MFLSNNYFFIHLSKLSGRGLLVFGLIANILFLSSCIANQPPQEPLYDTMPEEFRRIGMVSSSTYQVFVTTTADSREKALINGEALAKTRTYELIMNESFTRIRVSDFGRNKVKKVIEENGKIVRLAHEAENKWSISFQVNKIGLREYLQTIR